VGWPSILCKGGIYSADAPEQRAVWQVVGTRVDIALANEWGDRPPRTRIVAIGAHRALDGETRRERQSGTEPHHERGDAVKRLTRARVVTAAWKTGWVASALVLGLRLGITTLATAEEGKPNIVFILADNTGWGDFGVYGGQTPTPRIDALAKQGVRFTNYNVESQCTPTRAAILSGRYPIRSGTYTVPWPGQGQMGLAPWEYTIAELLSDAGYATALYGKWHVGNTPGRTPSDQGFDEWWGILNSSDEAAYANYPLFKVLGLPAPQLWEGRKGAPSKPVGAFTLEGKRFMDEEIAKRTAEFVKRQAKAQKPFFVYVGFTHVHPPLTVHPDFEHKSPLRGGIYADTIGEMDVRVGQILDAIQEAGIEDNTIIVFSSDNATGGVVSTAGGSNGPWRGNFFTPPFEGSYRVAAMVRWPGKIPNDVVTNEMLHAVDWLPTLAGLAGESKRVPSDRPIDGVDASAFLLGKRDTTGRETVLYFGSDGELMAVKWNTVKVILRYSEGISKPIVKPQFPLFFDLSSDPGETVNLWESTFEMGWMTVPLFRALGAYETSVAQFPNIKLGEEFEGYKAR
jgi:arylsulfatase